MQTVILLILFVTVSYVSGQGDVEEPGNSVEEVETRYAKFRSLKAELQAACAEDFQKIKETSKRLDESGTMPECYGTLMKPFVDEANKAEKPWQAARELFQSMTEELRNEHRACWRSVREVIENEIGPVSDGCREVIIKLRKARSQQ